MNFTFMKPLLTLICIFISYASIGQTKQNFVINFDFNKYEISSDSKLKLDSFLQSSSITSIQKINIYGHCDFVGNNTYNDALSLKRVTAVKDYLIDHNISENIFQSIKGYGKRHPLNQNRNDEERSMNRRVEINIERISEQKIVISNPEIKKDTQQKRERSLNEKIKDTATKTGTTIILKNMNFIGGRHLLLPGSLPTLTELLNTLKENPSLEIEIQGHVCCTIGAEDGLDTDTNTPNLSVNRAKAINQYLIEQGISPERLSYKGFGHRHPLVYPEDTEEKSTTNRRVEIKIIRR